jgi:hypothetical protein
MDIDAELVDGFGACPAQFGPSNRQTGKLKKLSKPMLVLITEG